jgi:hypothetical protein
MRSVEDSPERILSSEALKRKLGKMLVEDSHSRPAHAGLRTGRGVVTKWGVTLRLQVSVRLFLSATLSECRAG